MHILLAEDEKQLAHVVTTAIKSLGYTVDNAYDGEEAVKLAEENAYDVIILDIMMPKKTGIEALKEMRALGNRTYVIMLTAMSEIDDRVKGLDAGADDYITKPFSLKELLARLRSRERRNGKLDNDVLKMDDLVLDTNQMKLSAHNSISLSSKENRMMQYFILNEGKALSVDALLTHTWDDDDEQADQTDVWFTVSYLRQKLDSIGSHVVIKGNKKGPFTLTSI